MYCKTPSTCLLHRLTHCTALIAYIDTLLMMATRMNMHCRNMPTSLSPFSAMSEDLRGSYNGSSTPNLRLVLLGNLGCGKTSSGDTILGELSSTFSTASRSCQLRQGFSEGRKLTLVEAPRWYWSGGKMEDGVKSETERAVTLAAPGAHGILLLVPINQFTEVGFSF